MVHEALGVPLVPNTLGGVATRSSSRCWKSPQFSGFSAEQAPAVTWVDLALVHLLKTQGARMEKHRLLRRSSTQVAALIYVDLLCTRSGRVSSCM